MKRITNLLIALSIGCSLSAQNPFAQYSYTKVRVATASNGGYNEFFDNDSLMQIGTVILNTNTGKIVSFVQSDTSANLYQPQLVSRWVSPDPHGEKYNTMSPYIYGFNSPLNVIDPDGRDCVFTIERDKDGKITGLKISSTIYITGAGANQKRADALNKGVGSIFKSSNIQSNVNVSFDINYKYSEGIQSKDLKAGENMLSFTSKEGTDDDRSHITERMPELTSDGRKIEMTGNTGQIYKENWESDYTVYHESMHFLGISDRYSNNNRAPNLYFQNDVMGSYNSYNIGDTHYQSFLNYNRALNNLYPREKRFINTSIIDKTPAGDLYPESEKQMQQNPIIFPK